MKDLKNLMDYMKDSNPKFHGQHQSHIPTDLACAGYVYVRIDSHRHPLQRPYDDPFRIIKASDKYFYVNISL